MHYKSIACDIANLAVCYDHVGACQLTKYLKSLILTINTLRLRQNWRHFTDNIFMWHCAFSWMKMFEFRLKISLKFVPKGPIINIPALVQIMAWRPPGAKLLSELMMVRLPMRICVTWPQWVNTLHCGQYGYHFADYIFKCIFLHWSFFSFDGNLIEMHS